MDLRRERVLVLGATGWFGRTLIAMIPPEVPVLPIGGREAAPLDLAISEARDFAPTVVCNFAFGGHTPADEEAAGEYLRANSALTDRFIACVELPSVRLGLTTSSGAAVTEHLGPPMDVAVNPYGYLKAQEERRALATATPKRCAIVIRPYSVSGEFVREPNRYAFSNFIQQARTGLIHVSATAPTYRRYVSVGDLLNVALATGLSGDSGVIESGGELVEMGALAARVKSIVNPSAAITRAPQEWESAAVYASDNSSWTAACERLGYSPLTLDEQISRVAEALNSAPV